MLRELAHRGAFNKAFSSGSSRVLLVGLHLELSVEGLLGLACSDIASHAVEYDKAVKSKKFSPR